VGLDSLASCQHTSPTTYRLLWMKFSATPKVCSPPLHLIPTFPQISPNFFPSHLLSCLNQQGRPLPPPACLLPPLSQARDCHPCPPSHRSPPKPLLPSLLLQPVVRAHLQICLEATAPHPEKWQCLPCLRDLLPSQPSLCSSCVTSFMAAALVISRK
jgi:hypothetical protein